MKPTIPADFLKGIIAGIRKIVPEKTAELLPEKVKKLVPDKFHKWLIPGLVLVLLLCISLVCCSGGQEEPEETVLCTVAAEGLSVHKNPNSDSTILSQLPADLEIEILEQKLVNGGQWGHIGKMKLPDGTRTDAGWVDLQYVRFPGQEEPAAELESTEPPTEPPTVSTVIRPDPEQGITVMGTVVTGKLNIRKAAGSQYEAFDAYYEGDRVEIQEIVTVDDTDWGRTGKGWIGMGYVRLDGTAPAPAAEGENAIEVVSDGKWKVLGYGVVNLGELNVRQGPGPGYEKVATVTKCNRYAYYQVADDWVRIECGWVRTDYFYLEGTVADGAATGKVITDDLNVRTGPHTTFKSNGTLKNGDSVEILAQVSDWGYTAGGWISMNHVQLDEPTYTTGAGTVTVGLNIRKEPDADSEKVGEYKEGEQITILEVSDTWGRTDKGWINLKYVRFS